MHVALHPSGYQFGRGYDDEETKKDYAGLAELLKETANPNPNPNPASPVGWGILV